MKALLAIALLFSCGAFADELKLIPSDQMKISFLLGRMPSQLVTKTVTSADGGKVVQTDLSHEGLPFSVSCRNTYHNDARYPSKTSCKLELDVNDPRVARGGDEYRVTIEDGELAHAFFKAIPYGKPKRQFYSDNYDEGRTWEQTMGNIFDYRFICSETSCEARFFATNFVDR